MSTLRKDGNFASTSSATSQEAKESKGQSPVSALKVTLLSSEWRSTKGGLSTINRELAIQLAKHSNVEVRMYLPQCSEEDKRAAEAHNVYIIEAEDMPGYYDPIDWLATIPRNHQMDFVIGHGIHLGRQVPHIKRVHQQCKWIQVVHTDPEELGMLKNYADSIAKGEKKHQAEVKLCELADQVVAIGPKLEEVFSRYLRFCGKDQDVLTLTPGIFSEFVDVPQAAEERGRFRVLVFGRGDSEDFYLKGYDIAARAVAELCKHEPYLFKLVFVGAPKGEEEKVTKLLLKEGLVPSQLIVRSYKEREQLAVQFCEADLAIMPSRSEGFGLAALEALSAGLPVLVSGNSGLGDALKELPFGSSCVVNSEDASEWAKAIRAVHDKKRKLRLKEAVKVRESYSVKYHWEEECGRLVERMLNIIQETFTAPDQAVAAVNLGEEGPSLAAQSVSYPDSTNIEHIVGDAVSSGRENVIQEERPRTYPLITTVGREGLNAGIPERRQDVGSEDLRKYGVSVIKLLIDANNTLEEEEKEAIKKMLTQPFQACDDQPRGWSYYVKSFTSLLIKIYKVTVHDVCTGSIVVSLRCPTLESLEHLWSDYRSGDLDKLAERYLLTDDMKKKLKLETSYLKTYIDEENYRNCKRALMELPSTCSENPGKDLLHPSETTTTEKKRQNTDVPERIASNTKKEDATRNIPVSPLFASETLSNAEESSSHQPEQRCGEEDETAEARDPETCEVMSARIGEEHFSLEALLEQLPSPPSRHPNDTKDGPTCSTTASSPPSTSSVHRAASGGSSLWRDSYTWSIASSDLPFSLLHDEEKLVWPLQETFDIQDNQFEEGVQYDILHKIGSGAFGECYVASTSSGPPLFCIKKCQYKVNEILALYLAKTENIKEIVDYYGAKLKGRNAYICMEFMTGGTISDLVKGKRSLKAGAWPIIPEDTCLVFLEDILKGLKFLNDKGLVHRDIKGDSVLLDGEGTHAKLTGFGSAENIQERGGWSDDIWKAGCLHLEMLNGESSLLFSVWGGGLQRQSSVQPDKHFPSQAKEETIELLNLFFGINRDYMPSAAEILHVAHVFQ